MYTNIVVLTGAGISAQSGIEVFRSEDGLWEKHKVEDVATYMGFESNKELVHNFYNQMRQKVKTKEPNLGHLALTKLQNEIQKRGDQVCIITQNIDDLHERAKSNNIIHMHGKLNSLLCEHCHERIDFFANSSIDSICPHCHHKSMRPDIVWFGEMPYDMDKIEYELSKCDLFISIGTSGAVYPAASFVSYARTRNCPCLEFNLEPSLVKSQFTHAYYGKANDTLPQFVEYFLKYNNIPESL